MSVWFINCCISMVSVWLPHHTPRGISISLSKFSPAPWVHFFPSFFHFMWPLWAQRPSNTEFLNFSALKMVKWLNIFTFFKSRSHKLLDEPHSLAFFFHILELLCFPDSSHCGINHTKESSKLQCYPRTFALVYCILVYFVRVWVFCLYICL